MSLPSVVTVPFYNPSCRSGAAHLLSVVDSANVRVKFVIGGGRPCVVALERLAKEDREAVASYWTSKKEKEELEKLRLAVRWTSFKERETSTWGRLLRYGEICRDGHALSAVGMRALWGVALSDRANAWLDSHQDLPLQRILSCFVDVWWHYCCACAHTKVNGLDSRQKILVLELMCHSMSQKGSRHACVFGALLMQIVLLFCHDQSLCCAGANLDDVGYNHKVDCAKIGPVVRFSAVFRHSSTAACAAMSVSRVKDPKARIVWLLQKPSLKFRRLRKLNLFKFANGTRLDPNTSKIKYWSEDKEDYVYATDFHTTLDAVEFKRCGDQLRVGDICLENGTAEWKVMNIECDASNAHRPPVAVTLRREGRTKIVRCPFTRVMPVGTLNNCENAVAFLRDNPDVVDAMSLSTGPLVEHTRKSRSKMKMCDIHCRKAPLRCSWSEYLLWRCAVSAVTSCMDGQCARVVAPYARMAKFSWLVA